MKSYFILLFFLVLFGSINACEEDASDVSVCGGNNPVENLTWLKKRTVELEKSEFCHNISRANYKGQVVFIEANCSPNVASIDLLYELQRETVEFIGRRIPEFNFYRKS